MNEFIAKKLGEVVGFSRIGIELTERSGDAFEAVLTVSAKSFKETLTAYAEISLNAGNEVTKNKADATTEKLRGMMEAYIGDEWDNPTEIMEWMSFYCGAAAAHWSLVEGAAQTIGNSSLQTTAGEAKKTYLAFLETVIHQLHQTGQEKSGNV